MYAARENLYNAANLLIERDAEVNALNRNNDSALTLAAEQGHERMIQLLIDRKANINIVNGCGSTPLLLGETHCNCRRIA